MADLMAGTMRTPAPAGSFSGVDITVGNQLSASVMNSFRVAAVAERLASHVVSGQVTNASEFFNLCLSLARGIDYAVANDEMPTKAQDLPLLLKQICQRKNDLLLQAAIMVLMISIKNACKTGWFSDKETQELFKLANEIEHGFCTPRDINIEPSHSLSYVSTIMDRFYPRMKLGLILASLEVKPGYGAYMIDFNISKKTTHLPEEKIRLLVARTDNMETSACIISPQQANFLLNGKGVDRRTNVLMDPGPQMPTNVTPMLKYGTNLLQAVGQFYGPYFILVAFMSVTSSPNLPVLQHYVHPAVVTLDSDSDIIEGPSRISLNCPISYKRIKTPVKGHSCKHLQCFDFSNFIEINSRRPSWRCPHCNQYICFNDLRVDQNILKILSEVGENVDDVIISAEGSWKAILETDDHVDQAHGKTLNTQKEGSEKLQSTSTSNAYPVVLDLTEADDEMNEVSICETEDRKPSQANLQSESASTVQNFLSGLNRTNQINHNVATQVEDDFWAGLCFPNGSLMSSSRPDAQTVGSIFHPSPANSMASPVLTDAVSLALNQEAEGCGDANLTSSIVNAQLSAPNNLQLQQSQFVNSFSANEYGRLASIPRNVTRNPVAVQALPAQFHTPSPQQRSRTSVNNSPIPNSSPLPSQPTLSMAPSVSGFNNISSSMERQQQFSRAHSIHRHASNFASSTTQNRDRQDRPFILGQSVQQAVGTPVAPTQPSGAYGMSSPLSNFQNPHLQQVLNPRLPPHMSQSQSRIWPPSLPSSSQSPQVVAQVGLGRTTSIGNNQQGSSILASQRAAQRAPHMVRQTPSVPVQIHTPRTVPSSSVTADLLRTQVGEQRGNVGGMHAVPRSDGLLDIPQEQNWRPTGRMRGSLSGRAYSDALNQFMIPSNLTPAPSSVSPRIPILPNTRIPHPSYPMTEPSSINGASGVLPEHPC